MASPNPQVAQKELDRANLLTGLSGFFGATGAIVKGISGYQSALARATVYSANAAVIRAAIPQQQRAGDQQVDAIREDTAQLLANQRAALAANGVVVDQDTALDALIQAAGVGTRDVVISIHNSRQEIAKMQNQANQQEFEAQLSKREGKGSIISGLGDAATTILGAASTISNRNRNFGAT